MRLSPVLVLVLAGVALSAGSARAGCFPVRSEVFSLGEKAARFYAERSLVKAIDEQKGSLESSGNKLGRVTKGALSCKPFPNLIGADEWRCVGEAKLCTNALSGKMPAAAKVRKEAGLRRKNAAKQKK